jgi:hypothetical protein
MEKAKINQDAREEILIEKSAEIKTFVTNIRHQISEKLTPYL